MLDQGTTSADTSRRGPSTRAPTFYPRELADLHAKLAKSVWCPDTSYWPNRWSDDNPSVGQCAVTALLVQDLMGGEIEEVTADTGELHFRNIVPGLGKIDLTKDQFRETVEFGDAKAATRDDILANEDTVRRYKLLRALFEKL